MSRLLSSETVGNAISSPKRATVSDSCVVTARSSFNFGVQATLWGWLRPVKREVGIAALQSCFTLEWLFKTDIRGRFFDSLLRLSRKPCCTKDSELTCDCGYFHVRREFGALWLVFREVLKKISSECVKIKVVKRQKKTKRHEKVPLSEVEWWCYEGD